MGLPPPSSSPAATATTVDVQLLNVLREQNITQSRVWRGVLVVLGFLLTGAMAWQLYFLPLSSASTGDAIHMQYLLYMYKLAIVGYIGEASLVLWSRHPLVQWTTRCLVVISWLVSGVLYSLWQQQQQKLVLLATTTDTVNPTTVSAIVMGPRLFAAACWLARRELRALDADLKKLDRITPSY
ncbi:hypothetical protein DYB31_009062 [Aphanomyces astaci]|uniref:Uncharacterized protein n=1 Tax=Aphanomyces astaci TaxID=112090 RepID=A0A397ELB1_APHAT|nr:hypothetical protein DYB31_009062 [Aphanomyces astaci]